MLAIASALEGKGRAEAARLAGMERQALRDAVLRYNAEGLEGLRDRPKPGRPPALTEAEQAVLLNAIFRGPDRKRDGCVDWTLPALCRWLEGRFGKRLHPASLSRIVRRLDLSRQKTRPLHPQADEGEGRLRQRGLLRAVATAAAAHPDKRLELWFEDEARVGLKGRTGHRWWLRGERPRGLRQQGYEWAFLFGAVRPVTGEGFALVLPEVSTAATATFLERFAATRGPDAHVVLVLDQAGWHASRSLAVPPNVTLVPLPPYAPELNPVERVWLFLRERFLSHRLLEGYDAIVDACCQAWNALTPERIRSLTAYPWIARVTS